MFFKGVAEEGCEFVAPLSLVLVVLLGFDRRGVRRSARGVVAVDPGVAPWYGEIGEHRLFGCAQK
jgi:hypothetical protein